jgi:hypothetical protein
MSAGAIFQQALRVLNGQDLPEVSQRDLLAALEAGQPGPLAFLYDAGDEAGLAYEELLTRAVGIFYNFCAGNLADDLMDAECTYLAEPLRLGPCVQYILQSLSFSTLLKADLPAPLLASITRELVQAAGQQLIEIRTRDWTAPAFRQIAEGIAGRQWSAYLQILWYGTALSSSAVRVSMNAGLAGLVGGDIRSGDTRYTSLPDGDKRTVVAWARLAAQALRAEHLRCLDALLLTIDPILEEAL